MSGGHVNSLRRAKRLINQNIQSVYDDIGLRSGLLQALPVRIFGIGAQKGGTTSLFNYLTAHPELQEPTVKELQFFCCDRKYRSGVVNYQRQLPRKNRENAATGTFDVSPNYMLEAARSAPRIKTYQPDAKIVCLLRDPAERAYSAWQMYRRHIKRFGRQWWIQMWSACQGTSHKSAIVLRKAPFGENFLVDLQEETAALEICRRIDMPILEYGFYASQIAAYQAHFETDGVLVIDCVDFFGDAAAQMDRVAHFAGLAPIDWERVTSNKLYVGDYEERISKECRNYIMQYHLKHNELLGIR